MEDSNSRYLWKIPIADLTKMRPVWKPGRTDMTSLIGQGWRTSGKSAQNVTLKDLLGTRHSLLSHFLYSFARPASPFFEEYVYIYTYLTIYELPLLANNTAVKHFLHKSERCEVLTRYLSLGRRLGGDWANTWHWKDRLQYSFQTGRSCSPVTAKFSSLSHSWRRHLLEI
jgi:hypothetical protein